MSISAFELFPHSSILENLTKAQPKYCVVSLKRRKGIGYLDRVVGQRMPKIPCRALSGGQQQRYQLRARRNMDPIAMLFDEPTSALDA